MQQGAACLTFLYTPNNDTSVNDIVAAMRSNNIPVIPDSRTLGFASMTEVLYLSTSGLGVSCCFRTASAYMACTLR